MEYDEKNESKRRARNALQAAREVERYIEEISGFSADVQITRKEFDAAVAEVRKVAKDALRWQAFSLAVLEDEPCPVSLFKPWASYAQIRLWSMRPKDQAPLRTQLLNGKLCVVPTEFFSALKRHGRARPHESSTTQNLPAS
jgi:hypothetical protein